MVERKESKASTMTIRRPYAALLVLGLGLSLAGAQYPNPPGNSQRQLPVPPSAAAAGGPNKEPVRPPYGNGGGAADGRPPYPYGQFGQQQHQPGQHQQQNPSGQFSSNTDPFRTPNGNNPAANSLSAKLEQQLRPQNHQQQQQQTQQQQQKYPTGRYENNGASGYGNAGSPTANGGYGGGGGSFGGGYGGSGGGGVNIQVQLKAYANPERQIGQGRLCSCPPANLDCVNKSPSRAGYPCLFSFTVVVASDDAVIHRRSTPYLLLNANGQVAQESLASLQRPIDFQLDGEPSSVNVFVTSLGAVLDSAGNVEDWNTVTEVDTFVKPLRDGSAAGASSSYGSGGSSGSQPQQVNLVGTQLGTQLSLTYTVTCRNARLVGPGCDLSCNRSAVNSGSAICVSARTGYFSLCRWTAGNSQVTECKNCPWGIEENAYCRDENGGVLEANHAGVVSEGYQTATIILAIIAGILAFGLLVTCVYAKARVPKKGQTASKSRTPPAYSSSVAQPAAAGPTIYLKHGGDSEPPTATGGAPLPPRSGHIGQHYLPPLPPNGKAKASMRSPLLFPMPPPPHSLNDTMNSSFTGSQAPNGPPSVSADV